MNATNTKADLTLSEIWDALTAAGAPVYEWCEDGVAFGCQAIRLGKRLVLAATESDGYTIEDAPDADDLVPEDEYDDDAALREASDLDGFFGVVGLPGSIHHRFAWFGTEAEAREWVDQTFDAVLTANPALGTIESEIVSGAEAFDRTYQDGERIYFQPRECGAGYEPAR